MAEFLAGDVGDDAKLYRNTASDATPTWVECEGVRDLTLDDAWGEADVSSRASDFQLTRKNRRTVGVSFNMIHDPLDVDYVALRAAADSKTAAVQLLILPGPIDTVGLKGVKAWCQIFQHNHAQPLSGAQEIAFTAKPTRYYDTATLKPPVIHTTS